MPPLEIPDDHRGELERRVRTSKQRAEKQARQALLATATVPDETAPP